jgi:hypothetical protein
MMRAAICSSVPEFNTPAVYYFSYEEEVSELAKIQCHSSLMTSYILASWIDGSIWGEFTVRDRDLVASVRQRIANFLQRPANALALVVDGHELWPCDGAVLKQVFQQG